MDCEKIIYMLLYKSKKIIPLGGFLLKNFLNEKSIPFLIVVLILGGLVFAFLNRNGHLTARMSNMYRYAGNPERISEISFDYDYDGVNYRYRLKVTDKEDIIRFCEIINATEFEKKEKGGS